MLKMLNPQNAGIKPKTETKMLQIDNAPICKKKKNISG